MSYLAIPKPSFSSKTNERHEWTADDSCEIGLFLSQCLGIAVLAVFLYSIGPAAGLTLMACGLAIGLRIEVRQAMMTNDPRNPAIRSVPRLAAPPRINASPHIVPGSLRGARNSLRLNAFRGPDETSAAAQQVLLSAVRHPHATRSPSSHAPPLFLRVVPRILPHVPRAFCQHRLAKCNALRCARCRTIAVRH